jgi:arylsulfatase
MFAFSALVLMVWAVGPAVAAEKPNILVIWGDDVGVHNISAYNHGIMGYKTPNIDRIAKEGAMFTDAYAQQSCTAGRASFILGQHPFRTGLLTIGMSGSDHGAPDWAPTIADLLKGQGYATGQFGKNHLGDRDKHLPTNYGFDEFFGNLYHLNAEEEPETYYYPKDPEFKKKFDPRGVIHSYADGRIEDSRAADTQADGDRGRRVSDSRPRFHRSRPQGRQALLRLDEHHPHAHLDTSQKGIPTTYGHWTLPGRHGGAR